MTESAPVADSAAPADLSAHDELSIEEAMGIYANSEPKPVDDGDDPEIVNELASQEADADPAEEATGEETTEETDPDAEKLPPIERPRSWAKELDEEWASYPRAAQERILAREQERDAAIRRSQNEAAEARKAIEAERKQAEDSRKQYEAQLPALMQALQDAQAGAFADIKTVDDVTKLANEDPFRYLQWQAHQTKLQAVNAELQKAEQRKAQEQSQSWNSHIQSENAKAQEFIPELADKDKGPALIKRAADRLSELGFTSEELSDLASGKQKLSVYDHRIQRLIVADLKLQDIQNAPKALAKKDVPPVQRPGTAKPPGAQNQATVQNLTRKLETTGSLDDAFALFQAQSRRAS